MELVADSMEVRERVKDLLHGEIPVYVHDGFEANGGEGDVPGFDRRRGWIEGEELDVDGIAFVWGTGQP